MAILEATIKTRVNQITGRDETSITDLLQEILIDLSRQTLRLETEASGTTVAEQAYIDAPSDMIDDIVDGLTVGGETLDPITWLEWMRQSVKGYCFRANRIYIRPTPEASTAYTLYYPRVHPDVSGGILFGDAFKDAIIHGVASKVYEKYEIWDEVKVQKALYAGQIAGLSGGGVHPPVVVPRTGVRL